jgi:hypothetical protein
MNNGMAMMMKLSVPDQTRWGMVRRNTGFESNRYRIPEAPIA